MVPVQLNLRRFATKKLTRWVLGAPTHSSKILTIITHPCRNVCSRYQTRKKSLSTKIPLGGGGGGGAWWIYVGLTDYMRPRIY